MGQTRWVHVGLFSAAVTFMASNAAAHRRQSAPELQRRSARARVGVREPRVRDEVAQAGRTAIARRAPARPIRMLLERGLVRGTVLHHGRGRDVAGSDAMAQVATSIAEYDPNHANRPEVLTRRYDTVVSNFVLNVLPPTERQAAISELSRVTGGSAYISVRAAGDRSIVGKREADGVRTRTGTFQKPYTVSALLGELRPFFQTVRVIAGSDRAESITVEARDPLSR